MPYGPLVVGQYAAFRAATATVSEYEAGGHAERWVVRLGQDALSEMKTIYDADKLLTVGTTQFYVIRGLGLPGQILVCSFGSDSEEAAVELRTNPKVASFSRDLTVHGQSLPDDPAFVTQWALNNMGQESGTSDADIDAPEAWNITTGDSSVVVGIIDTGIDYTHPDLASNIWTNPREIPGNGIDDDENEFIDDVHGYDFRNNDGNPMDDNGHGTHVAGTIGAVGNNGQGVVGVNWNVSLMALKFLDANNEGYTADAIRATCYATMMRTRLESPVNLRVLNNSWVVAGYNSGLEEAIAEAGDADILFVTAAGNGDAQGHGVDVDQYPVYPACFDLENIISVAASDRNDQLAQFSNYGRQSIDVAAPGVGILSTAPGVAYAAHDGTSMATPHVSGTAALICASVPGATAEEVRKAILTSTDPKPGMQDKLATGGRLNAWGALLKDTNLPRAALESAPDVKSIGGTHQDITVLYTDNLALNIASFDNSDITVTRLNGAGGTAAAKLYSVTPQYNGSPRTAVYRMPAPGGRWDMFDCGTYQINLQANQVTDTHGNFARPAVLGTFQVNLSAIDVFRVDSYADGADVSPGDGLAEDSTGHTTLRAAIQELNALPGGGTVILDSGVYRLTRTGAGEDDALTGDLDIRQVISLMGVAADQTTVDAAGLDRVFDISSGGELTVSNLTVSGGVAPAGQNGGGILNAGRLTVTDCAISGNAARSGAGIYSSVNSTTTKTTTIVTGSTISSNIATEDAGAIYNNSVLTLTNDTISVNTGGSQGAIFNSSTATATITNCTIVDNSSNNLDNGDLGRLGGESKINTTYASSSVWSSGLDVPDIVADGLGRYIVVWKTPIRGQRLSSNGTPLGSEFRISGTSETTVDNPAVSADASGRFVVVWESQISGTDAARCIRGQRYDADGTALGGIIDIGLAASSAKACTIPDVAMAADGSFIVTWTVDGAADGAGKAVYARRFDSDGNPLAAAFLVNTTTSGDQHNARAAVDATGRALISWVGDGVGGAKGVFLCRFASDGAPLSAETRVNTTASKLTQPDIAVGGDGGFILVFGADDWSVRGQLFDASGVKTGGEFRIDPQGGEIPAVATAADGDYVVTWGKFVAGSDGGLKGVFGRRLGPAGTSKGSVFLVNTTIIHAQWNPAIAAANDGSLLIVWAGVTARDLGSIAGQRFTTLCYNGGIFNSDGGVVNLANTIVVGNSAGHGSPDLLGNFVSGGSNLVGTLGEADGIQHGVLGDLIVAAARESLGPLADNGGPTLTHALLAGSPAIDVGGEAAAPVTDQRGVPRPQDGNNDGTAVVDIGAFELVGAQGASQTGDEGSADPADWFAETPAAAYGLASFSAGSATETGPTGDRWIVQFATGTSLSASTVSETIPLLQSDGASFDVVRGLGSEGLFLVQAPRLDSATAETLLRANPCVMRVERDGKITGLALSNDPRLAEQWSLDNTGQTGHPSGVDIDASEAWDITTGSARVVVGVLDTGIDATHPDLIDNVWTNPGEIPGNGIDDDRNGFVDDVHGYDFCNNRGDSGDDNGHGTHVAGIIGAVGNNAVGTAGVNWTTTLVSLKFLNADNEGSVSDAVRAINYAVMMHDRYGVDFRVLASGWCTAANSEALYEAIELAGDAGMLLVAAAGNGDRLLKGVDTDSYPVYPACYDLGNTLSVAASTSEDSLAAFSNYGVRTVHLAAPGVSILSTEPGGTYAVRSGTSMAAAEVAGVAALICARSPTSTVSEVRAAILEGTESAGALAGKLASGGRLSALGALTSDTRPPSVRLIAAPDVVQAGGTAEEITVHYADNQGLDVSTLDGHDLVVTRISGLGGSYSAELASVTPVSNGSPRSVVYRMTAPGGTWDVYDSGWYQISLSSGQVADTAGNFLGKTVLGTFQVCITADGVYLVDSFDDASDSNPGDGLSDDGGGRSTLRSAIQELNSRPGGGTLVLDAGTYVLDVAGINDDSTLRGDLDITGTVTIIGAGANRTTIDAAGLDRVFDVRPGGVLIMSGVTITGGAVQDNTEGGGIRNANRLTLTGCIVTGNVSGAGGGIYTAAGATSTIDASTISGNLAQNCLEEVAAAAHEWCTHWTFRFPLGDPAVAGNAAGNSVIVWEDTDSGEARLFAIRCDSSGPIGLPYGYDPAGVPSGMFFEVANSRAGTPKKPSAAMDADGNFVIAWEGQLDSQGLGVAAQRYHADGTPWGSRILVNQGYQTGSQCDCAVAAAANGNFVVVWNDGTRDGSGWGIYGQLYSNTGARIGGEFRANSYVTGDQRYPRAAMDENGDFVVVWEGVSQDGSGRGVYAQLYSADGTPRGTEFRVNSTVFGDQSRPGAAMDYAGNFIVTWVSPDSGGSGVFAARYDSSGQPLGKEFQVNTYVAGDQRIASVAMDPVGNALFSWVSYGQDGDQEGCYARLYNPHGLPQGSEFRVTETGSGVQTFSAKNSAALDASGNCLFAWHIVDSEIRARQFKAVVHAHDGGAIYNAGTTVLTNTTVSGNIAARQGGVYNADSATLTLASCTLVDNATQGIDPGGFDHLATETKVNTGTAASGAPDVTVDAAGNYVIAWQDTTAIRARRWDALGTPLSIEIRVSAATEASPASPAVAANSSGDFVVAWSATESGDSRSRIYAQRYDADGAPLGSRIEVQPPQTGVTVRSPDVALAADGRFAVVWVDASGTDGSGYGVFGRWYDASGAPAGAAFLVNTRYVANQDHPAVAADSAGNFVVAWDSNEVGNYEVCAQRFDSAGIRLGGEFAVNYTIQGDQLLPAIAASPASGFAIAFRDTFRASGDGGGIGAQLFDAYGSPGRTLLQVNTYRSNANQTAPAIAFDSAGNLLIAWQNNQQSTGLEVYARRYDPLGVPRSDEFRVNATTSLDQRNPAVAFGPNGNAIIVWDGNGVGSTDGIFAQRFSLVSYNGGILNASSGTTTLRNTIVAGNSAPHGSPDLLGQFTTNGNNLIGTLGVATGIVAGVNGDQVVKDARERIGPLEANGGLTPTHALLPGSTAIDAGANSGAPDVDQRGVWRPQDAGGDGSALVDIGAFELYHGVILGTRYRDLNRDGVRDPEEPGLAGLTVFLDANGNGVLDAGESATQTLADNPATSDADEAGTFCLPQVVPGTYVVAEVLVPGWQCTSPAQGRHTLNIPPGQIAANVDFGDWAVPGEISGRVFNDIDGDGSYDADEAGLGGWEVFLDRDRNGICNDGEPVLLTGADGSYVFSDLLSAVAYSVNLVQKSGWERSFPRPTDGGIWRIGLGPGEVFQEVDFGVYNIQGQGQSIDSALAGRVFGDTDGDGVQDAGEPGLVGCTVYLDLNNNGRLDAAEVSRSVTTVADNPATPGVYESGDYRLLNLPAGSYLVRTVPPAGYHEGRPIGNQLNPTTYALASGAGPQCVAAADFTGDGRIDLATANYGRSSVSVLANIGGGLFSLRPDISVGSLPTSVVACNLDGDGDIDLAVTNQGGSNLSILLNQGDGTFPVVRSVAAGAMQRSVAAGDIDHDGDTDLVVANELPSQAAGTLSILKNNGDATFAARTTLTTGKSPYCVILAQLNADNYLDIAVANLDSSTVSIYWNNGNGTFSAPLSITVAAGPGSLAAGDLDGNGSIDLVVTNTFANAVSVLKNNGNGTFAAPVVVPLGVAPYAVALADMELDGDLDLLVSNPTAQHLYVLRNGGSGAFSPREPFGVGAFPVSPSYSVAAVDYDGNGTPDAAVSLADATTSSVAVVLNYLVPGTYSVSVNGAQSASGLDFAMQPTANAPPTLNAVPAPTPVNEDAGLQQISLSGISAGSGESQVVRITATSSNTDLIPDPGVSYASPAATGFLTYAPATDRYGSAMITITVRDAGWDGILGNGDDASYTTSFIVTVNAVNDVPTLDPIANPPAVGEDAGVQTAYLAGISAGGGEGQSLLVTAASDNTGLIPNPTVSYVSPSSTASLHYTPAADRSGIAVLTVTVRDAGLDGILGNGDDLSVSRSFTVVVNAVNDVPTLATIPDPAAVVENSPTQTVSLSEITAGGGESQTLLITATSNNMALIPHPTVSYTSPNSGGSLFYTPAANQGGTARITVTVRDAGLDGILGNADDATFARAFNVSVNRLPTIDAIANPAAINEDASQQTITLTGISAGSGESQPIQVSAVSSNSSLIASTTVTYTSPGSTASLKYTPVANASGTAMITVTVRDGSLDGVLGTADDGLTVRTFTVTVNPVNDPPTFDPILNPAAINEDSGAQNVALSNIAAGGGESQDLQVTATSGNTALIPHPTVTYTSPYKTGGLTYTPVANASGTAVITVILRDAGLDAALGNADDATATKTFTVTVTAVNDPPTLTSVSDPAPVSQDSGQQTISLSGISAGGGESQTLQMTAASSNTSLIPNPTVTYTSPATTGSLKYTPVAGQSGTAVITVTVRDAGLDGTLGNSDDGTLVRTFTVVVTPVVPPTLDAIVAAVINEDAATQTVSLTGITAGAGESQPLAITASSDNPALISAPTVSYTSPASTGSLSFAPLANQTGIVTITVTVRDGGLDGILNTFDDATFSRSFIVTVNPVNDAPSFVATSGTIYGYEDTGPQTSTGRATSISAGPTDESTQSLQFLVSTSNDALFSVLPAINPVTGAMTWTAAPDAYNSSITVTVSLRDSGGTANGGVDTSPAQTYTLYIFNVNDPPSFVKGADQVVNEGSGSKTVANWATAISKGPGNESSQTLTFLVVTDNDALFSTVPAINATTGTLTYTPAPGAFGVATVAVQLRDNGGTSSGGIDTSPAETFTIAVNPINDRPSFTKGADQAIIEDGGTQTLPGWATAVSAGSPYETSQLLSFGLTTDNDSLFASPPTISPSGTLSYTPAPDAHGTAHVTVTLRDDGGTANGGQDTSSAQTFTIDVASANDAPSFVIGADQTILAGAGPQTIPGWATAISAGPADESAQTLSFITSTNNLAMFSVLPAVDAANGTLTFTPSPGAAGAAFVRVWLHDDGGTANCGSDTSAPQTFTITLVTPGTPSAITLSRATVGDYQPSGTIVGVLTTTDSDVGDTHIYTLVAGEGDTDNAAFAVVGNELRTYESFDHETKSVYSTRVRTTDRTGLWLEKVFTITVIDAGDLPTLDAIPDCFILEDAGQQINELSGITAGSGQSQALCVTAASSNNNLIPHPFVSYVSPSATGSLTYTSTANASGTAVITITVQDAGLDGTLNTEDDATITRQFTVTVTPVNDPPVVAQLTDSPDPQEFGRDITLTATGVGDSADPGGWVASVTFYRESNGAAGLQIGSGGDAQVAVDTDPGGGWSAVVSTSGLSPGTYTYYALATDNEGLTSADGSSAPWTVNTVAESANLDADGNDTADALSDGILILRYLFDPTGAWNVNDAVGSGATRTTRQDIKIFLDGGLTTTLDADGNGTADPLTDGILILRYLFDRTGSWTVNDALSTDATRTTWEAIKAYLDQFNPKPLPAMMAAATDSAEDQLSPSKASPPNLAAFAVAQLEPVPTVVAQTVRANTCRTGVAMTRAVATGSTTVFAAALKSILEEDSQPAGLLAVDRAMVSWDQAAVCDEVVGWMPAQDRTSNIAEEADQLWGDGDLDRFLAESDGEARGWEPGALALPLP